MATFYNFTGYQGDYLQLSLNVTSSSGTAISFSGYDVKINNFMKKENCLTK